MIFGEFEFELGSFFYFFLDWVDGGKSLFRVGFLGLLEFETEFFVWMWFQMDLWRLMGLKDIGSARMIGMWGSLIVICMKVILFYFGLLGIYYRISIVWDLEGFILMIKYLKKKMFGMNLDIVYIILIVCTKF